jgi:hypothetical protein
MALASASPAAPTGGVLCQPSVGDRPSELTKCKKTNGSAYTALAIGIAAGKRWKTQGGSKSGAMEQIGAERQGAWKKQGKPARSCLQVSLQPVNNGFDENLDWGLLGAAGLTLQASAAADQGPCVTTGVSGNAAARPQRHFKMRPRP